MSAQALDSTNLIEPRDVTSFPLAKSASPNGVEYIGKIEVQDITAGTTLEVVTYGGVTQSYVVDAGSVVTGPITSITANTDITRCRVWYLSGT